MDGRILFQNKEIVAQGEQGQRCEMRHALICCGCGYEFGSCFADALFAADGGPFLDHGAVVLRSGFRRNAAGTFVRNRAPRRLPGIVIDDEPGVQPSVVLPSEASGVALDVSKLPIVVQCPRCPRRNVIPPFNIWRNPRTGEVGI